jgi:hypothetical protein
MDTLRLFHKTFSKDLYNITIINKVETTCKYGVYLEGIDLNELLHAYMPNQEGTIEVTPLYTTPLGEDLIEKLQ